MVARRKIPIPVMNQTMAIHNFCRILTMVVGIERIVLLDFIHRLVSQKIEE
jgi:hypothetical protein